MRRDSRRAIHILGLGVLVLVVFVLAGCSSTTSAQNPAQMPPPEVIVATVEQKNVPIYREWIGTLDGMVNAAIKAQVTGYLLRQNYIEGSYVKKGDLLFEIDPRPFQAAVDQANGQLAQANGQLAQANGQLAQAKAQLIQSQAQVNQAQATQVRMQLDVDRYTPLAKEQAITQQDLDNAVQNNLSAKAQVEAAKAQVETAKAGVETANAQIQAATAAVEAAKAAVEAAKVNLGFTKLTAPIDGIAGQAQVQVGNLVSPAGGPITTVSTLDPIKSNFTVSEQEYLSFRRQAPGEMSRFQLELILADGSTYQQKGKFLFADREVNQSTGALLLIGTFPNPGNVLRPGQYAKVRTAIGTKQNALLIPQRAVTELQGNYQVAVVDQDNKVSVANVKVGERLGTQWMIDEGL